MSELILKEMSIDDVKISSELFYEVFTSEEWKFSWLTKDKAYNYFLDMFKTPNFNGFLLIDEEEIIGACLGVGNPHFINNQFEIKEFFIKPTLQKKGIGSLFLNKIENTLIEMNYDLITLYTQKTIPAYKLYEKKQYNTLKDTVHMMKIL